MLQSNNNGELPDLGTGLVDDLGMDTDMKPSINPLNNPSPAGKCTLYYSLNGSERDIADLASLTVKNSSARFECKSG